MTKTIHIAIASDGNGRLVLDREDSTRDTHCAVRDVPEALSAATVMLQVSRLIFWPWPRAVAWPDIAELPPGQFVRRAA
jgi:hypothetical protein